MTPEYKALIEMTEEPVLKDQELVQKAWKDLCSLIQPGGADGADAMNRTIKEGPPMEADRHVLTDMRLAYNDKRKLSTTYGDSTTVWEAIITGLASDGVDVISTREQRYLKSNYSQFIEWCNKVFPG